ncbi:4-oxalocrotonate tautomerase family protein [Actinoplanes sp. NPDC051513]|uniref:4-oxalocrotonate tautomerase family protein n=1 Tax=Actinoplanes sp. NPDC051513 TaxID=3363908 RepID=UPI0037AFF5B9
MPHLTVHAAESDLTGREPELIAALTDAVVAVYGEWAREIAVVLLIGVPAARWGVGGKAASSPAPRVTFGIRATVFDRPDAADVLSRLAAGVTDAIAGVVGDQVRPGVTVEFVGSPDGRTGVGGVLVAH